MIYGRKGRGLKTVNVSLKLEKYVKRRKGGVKRLKWLYPGMGIKRWFSLLAVGIFFIGVSMSNPFRRMIIFLFPEDSYSFTERNLLDRKSTRLNSSHIPLARMPSSA